MAEGIYSLREAHKRLAGRGIGGRPEQPTLMASQKGAASGGAAAHIMGMPQDVSEWQELQCTDVTSANLGLFWFRPDYDKPGDPTKPIR